MATTPVGERITRVETKIDNMVEQNKREHDAAREEREDIRTSIKSMQADIRALTNLLEQFKGARWTLGGIIFGIGLLGGKLGSFIYAVLSGMPR